MYLILQLLEQLFENLRIDFKDEIDSVVSLARGIYRNMKSIEKNLNDNKFLSMILPRMIEHGFIESSGRLCMLRYKPLYALSTNDLRH